MAETGFSNGGIMSFNEHAQITGCDVEKNNADMYKVARTLIDAAYDK